VRFWGVGNESWGCGGNFTPEEYATEFRRSAWLPNYGHKPALVGAGPNGGDLGWTRRFFSAAEGSGRSALHAGLTLDTFVRHADKMVMANMAQLVNCLPASVTKLAIELD